MTSRTAPALAEEAGAQQQLKWRFPAAPVVASVTLSAVQSECSGAAEPVHATQATAAGEGGMVSNVNRQ